MTPKRVVLGGVAGPLVLAVLAVLLGACSDETETYPVCVEVASNVQVDEDYCQEHEDEYDPSRYRIIYLRKGLITNPDAIVERDADTKKPTIKKTTVRTPVKTTTRRTATTNTRRW